MLNNNHNDSSCAFAEQIVSYLYGETDVKEKIKFEIHLERCSTCADEFADFGFVHSSILEWRDEDFSKLPTPVFEIPMNVKETSDSWFDGFRKLFIFKPALAATAFAALVVCVGLTLFAVNFFKNSEIAKNLNSENSNKVAVSPTTEKAVIEAKDISDESKEKVLTAKSSQPSEDTLSTPNNNRQVQNAPKNSAVKVSSNNVKSNVDNSVKTVADRNENSRKTTPVRKKQVPTLTDMDEDEDDSVRLADLFAELDTK